MLELLFAVLLKEHKSLILRLILDAVLKRKTPSPLFSLNLITVSVVIPSSTKLLIGEVHDIEGGKKITGCINSRDYQILPVLILFHCLDTPWENSRAYHISRVLLAR